MRLSPESSLPSASPPSEGRFVPTVFLVLGGVAALAGCAALRTKHGGRVADDPFAAPPAMIVPDGNETTPERVALGKALFFDPRLSGSRWVSCATCHQPGLGWSDGLPTAIGTGMKPLKRASPTLVNVGYARILQWDGREETLELEAFRPIQNKDVMDMPLPTLVERLSAIPGYRDLFERAYPGQGIRAETIGKALAAFERTIVSNDTPFDRWRRGDESAVSDAAKRGFALFRGKARCQLCHDGFNFTDDGFHNIGLPTPAAMTYDEGRYAVRRVAVAKGAFKTPTLRDVELTPPYMHNGVYRTLDEVVDHYDRGGAVKDNLDPNMQPLHLADGEKADLIAFLKTLTSPNVEFPVPRLPH